MAYEIIPNAILFAAIAGMLGIFFRHVPEAVEEGSKSQDAQLLVKSTNGSVSGLSGKWSGQDYSALISQYTKIVWEQVGRAGAFVWQKIWHFMLEAKDLKQGQILASKFARMVTPNALRYTDMAVHTPMTDAEEFLAAGKFDEAEQKYFEVLKKFPHEYTAYEGLVKIYLQQKQYENLSETLEYLVRHVPENDTYWAQYGNVLMSTRHYNQAIAAFDKSVELNPLIPSRFANLGLSHQAVGEHELAKTNFKKASELEPSNVQYLVLLSEIMVQLEETEQAIELLVKAKEMLPEDAGAILQQLTKITSLRDHLQEQEK